MAKKTSGGKIAVILGVTTITAVGVVWFYRKYIKGLGENLLGPDSDDFAGVTTKMISGCAGCTQVSGMGPDKERAQRWLAAKTEHQGETPVEHEIIDTESGMELERHGEFAKVLQRAYGQSVAYEHVPWNGIGRPEW
jgi:hypothetical protein